MGVMKKRLRIGGMTCVSCQNKIERKLKNTAGVKDVSVSYNTGYADITYDSAVITLKDIKAVINKLGYEALPETGTSGAGIGRTIGLLAIIVSLYVVLERFGILNLLVPSQLADTKMGYGMLFVIGLITSVHCIAMCGGINLSQCIPQGEGANESGGKLAAFRPAVLYNLGRVVSYTVIGFILGAVGMLLGGGAGAGLSTLFQGILKIIAGVFMVIMGINMLGIFPWLRRFTPRMPKFLTIKIGKKKAASSRPFIVGLLNGLMPCGPLQSMQIVALASGNPLAGALSMFLFSLGTVPLMLGFGSLVSALGKRFSRAVMNVGAVLVVVLGLAMLSQGGSLSGLLLPSQLLALVIMLCVVGVIVSIPFTKELYNLYRVASVAAAIILMVAANAAWSNMHGSAGLGDAGGTANAAEIQDGVQLVNSTLTSSRYPNITVQAGIPVKWVIDAPAGSINGCNNRMLINEYGIEHTFTQGENIIEFTPTTPGTVQYTCWMGMMRGNIFVTDEDGTIPSDGQTADVPVPAGYQIPSDQMAVAQPAKDENGQDIQEVSIDLTENGFSPAVVVVESGRTCTWHIHNALDDAEAGTELLAPEYSKKLQLAAGDNGLYLYPQNSFEVSTGDHRFYAYVKVVDDLSQIDEAAIRQEVDGFQTLIYPELVFEGSRMSCCGGSY